MRLADHHAPATDPLHRGLQHLQAAEPDAEQAVHWFRIAAEAGDAEALAQLAICQLNGLGLPRDPVEARARLEQAAAAGSLSAQFHLGRALVSGWGGASDAARGRALYTAAAARGHADASFNLACCLEAGWGCQPDRLAAKALFLRARTLGSALKAPGLRIRSSELGAVRELLRRLDPPAELARVLDERQREIALMQDLRRQPERRAMLSRQRRRRVLQRVSRAPAFMAALLAVVASSIGWRGPRSWAHDSGPTSIA